jgi:hypothetical protein
VFDVEGTDLGVGSWSAPHRKTISRAGSFRIRTSRSPDHPRATNLRHTSASAPSCRRDRSCDGAISNLSRYVATSAART